MRNSLIALALIALPVHAQQIYRCVGANGASYQDHPCAAGSTAASGGYVQAAPAPGVTASDHYRNYLQMAEHDEAVQQQRSAVAVSAVPALAPVQSETERRAVFNCNADAQVDSLRHDRPTFSCDQHTGEKKLVEQVIVVDRQQAPGYQSR